MATKMKIKKHENLLENVLRKMFYKVSGKKEIIVTVDRVSEVAEGYKYNAHYDGDLAIPDIFDIVSKYQEAGRLVLEADKNKNHVKMSNVFKVYEFDPLGIKRVMDYLEKKYV